MPTIARIADEHRMGRVEHGRTLWQFVMLERSMKRMFGSS
jgi:asparagine synthase (glutamine-hydrolysing)